MGDGAQTVCGPYGVEVIISFLPNNEILVRVPLPFVVRSETFEVFSPPSCYVPTNLPQRNAKRRRHPEGKEENNEDGIKRLKLSQSVDLVGWESLPSELFHLVCEWLPFDVVLRLNEVCSLWKAALDDETLWRRRYTQSFGPLSSCHLNLPRPPHLRDVPISTPTKVLKWKKRSFVMRNISKIRDVNDSKAWALLHGCSLLIEQTTRKNADWNTIAMLSLLMDDIKTLKLAMHHLDNYSVRVYMPFL